MTHARALWLVAAVLVLPVGAAAQVRTRPVDVHWYVQVANAPAFPPAAPGELLALDCERNVSPPFRATRCHPIDAAALQRRADLLTGIAQCYGVAAALPPRPATQTVAALQQAFESSRSGADRIAVALPAPARPLLVLVRWHDRGTGMRCARWTRHCTGIDCNMSGARRFCAEDVPVATTDTHVEWGWLADGAMVLTDAAPYLDTGGRLLRFDTGTPTSDYVTAVNHAIDAWLAGDEAELHAAIAAAAAALPAAVAGQSPSDRATLTAGLEALQRVDGYRGHASLRSPCP